MVLRKSQGPISLFDIRLNGNNPDTVVIRGTPEEASSMVLSGNIAVSMNDAVPLKRISLKLIGTMRLHWHDRVMTPRGQISRPVKFEKVVFEHEWPDFITKTTTGSSPGDLSRSSSSNALASSPTPHTRSKSSSNLMSLGSTGTSSVKLHGNHVFPFDVILPGDIPETVENMEGGQVLYKLDATIERGKFTNNIHCRKYLRLIRTVGSDNFELSQTVSVENTWPKKVEYKLSIPSKAVAIGGSVPIDLIFQPLLKGLQLGKIKIQLYQMVQLSTPFGQTSSRENVVHEHVIPAPEGEPISLDLWEVHELVPLPTSLSKCTQDASIGAFIKVTHKLKFAVSLINPDGHISELRASLPMYLFISPQIPITSANPTILSYGSQPRSEDTLFGSCSEPVTRAGSIANMQEVNDMDFNAPPNYKDHVYDRLYAENSSQPSSQNSSESSTPYSHSRKNSISESEHPKSLSMIPIDERSKLADDLRALAFAQNRGSQVFSPGSNPASGSSTPFPIPLVPGSPNTDYFSLPGNSGSSHSHVIGSPDFLHMSRVGSPVASGNDTPDLESLSRVPSYSTALQNNANNSEFAPQYPVNEPSAGSVSASVSPVPSALLPPSPGSKKSSGLSKVSSSSALNFLTRSHSSRSLLSDAAKLARIHQKHDKQDKHDKHED